MLDNILKNGTAGRIRPSRTRRPKRIARPAGTQWIFRYGMVLALIALTIVTAILDPSFLQANNF